MNFLNPFALGALGLGAFVTAIYFLKKRPMPFEVSALFLWPEATSKSRSAWRWYKAPISLLLLQLLVLALLIFGMSEPVAETRAQGAGRLALIMDTSASMQTVSDNGTRHQQALARAQALLDAHPNAEFTLIEARNRGGVVVPLTSDNSLVNQALNNLSPTFLGDVALADVVQWVQSQGAWASFDRVVWLTDHLPADDGWRDYGIEFDLVAEGYGNAAVTAFMIRPQPQSSLGYEAFVQVDNFSHETLNANLRLKSFNETLMGLPVEIEAGGSQQWAFPLSLSIPRQLTVSVDANDGLMFDNERHFSFQSQLQTKVFWVGEQDRFLEQLFLILGVESVNLWSPNAVIGRTDLIVVNQVDLTAFNEGNVLLIHAGWDGLLSMGEELEIDQNRATDLQHPVLQRTTPENIIVSHGLQGNFPPEFVSLIEGQAANGQRHPLLGAYEQDDIRLIWMGFSLDNTNLRLTVDFPILVSNVLKWLVRVPVENAVLETGETLFFNGKVDRLTLPSEQSIRVEGDAFLQTLQPGFYTPANRAQSWAVNVPVAESVPANQVQVSTAAQSGAFQGIEQSVSQPLWMYFAWIGLAVLGLEWISYERGWM